MKAISRGNLRRREVRAQTALAHGNRRQAGWPGDRSGTEGWGRSPHVLVVSEDPTIIVEAQRMLGSHGAHVVGCLGPAQTPCVLDDREVCPLAAHTSVAIVDAPATGSFKLHWKDVTVGEYATRLARAHPACFVILCGAPLGASGYTGEVAHATNARSALAILR